MIQKDRLRELQIAYHYASLFQECKEILRIVPSITEENLINTLMTKTNWKYKVEEIKEVIEFIREGYPQLG